MSYHINLATSEDEPTWCGWNYTSNCAPMWRAAGADLATFDGRTARDCLPVLTAAINAMRADALRYTAMNPGNGWGSFETLLPALQELADAFADYPDATVKVSR